MSFRCTAGTALAVAATLLVSSLHAVTVAPRHCHGEIRHLHIAVGPDPATSMTVSFASAWAFPDRRAPIAGVHVGTSPDNLDRFVPEQEYPLTYELDARPVKPGHFYYAPYQHHITIEGLEPDTKYYYVPVIGTREHYEDDPMSLALKPIRESMQVEHVQVAAKINNDDNDDRRLEMEIEATANTRYMWDREGRRLNTDPYNPVNNPCIDARSVRSFKTAPLPGNEHYYPMTFGIIGDLGQFEHSIETVEHMRQHNHGIQAVVLVGDIAYPGEDGRRWDTFFDFLDDHSYFDEVPLMVAAGNHDIDMQPTRKGIFLAYETRFRMPQVHPPELGLFQGQAHDAGVKADGSLEMDAPPYPLPYEWGNAYYAFTYGPARHVIVCAYSDMSPGSKQHTWLENELASVDRERTPWVFLTIHVPLYNTFAVHHHDPQIFAAREHVEPLLVKYNVNLVLNGHVHAYQRTKYVAFNETTPTAPMHITIGAGGRQAKAPFQNEEPESWIATRDESKFGYGRLCIFNATHAEWKWVPLSTAEDHTYNEVQFHEELHLAALDHDRLIIENQYHVRLENERRERRNRRLHKASSK